MLFQQDQMNMKVMTEFLQRTVVAAVIVAACFASANAQVVHQPMVIQSPMAGSVPSSVASSSGEVQMTIPADANCACRNIPGGYPCTSNCKNCMMGVESRACDGSELRWRDMRPMKFNAYGQGAYAGPSRLAHLSEYRLRPGDQIQVIYLLTRRQSSGEYRLAPGDEVLIESVADQGPITRHARTRFDDSARWIANGSVVGSSSRGRTDGQAIA